MVYEHLVEQVCGILNEPFSDSLATKLKVEFRAPEEIPYNQKKDVYLDLGVESVQGVPTAKLREIHQVTDLSLFDNQKAIFNRELLKHPELLIPIVGHEITHFIDYELNNSIYVIKCEFDKKYNQTIVDFIDSSRPIEDCLASLAKHRIDKLRYNAILEGRALYAQRKLDKSPEKFMSALIEESRLISKKKQEINQPDDFDNGAKGMDFLFALVRLGENPKCIVDSPPTWEEFDKLDIKAYLKRN